MMNEHVKMTQLSSTVDLTELGVLDVVKGTVTADKACVASANKDLGDFRNLDCVNLDAGSDAVAGTIDIFPSTTGNGKLILSCSNQGGAHNVEINAAAQTQGIVISIPDVNSATANIAMSTLGLSLAEVDVLDGAVAGTAAVGKVLIPTTDKTIDDLNITTLKIATVPVTAVNQVASMAQDTSTIVLSAGGATTQTATITLKDATPATITAVQRASVYMCTDAAGATPSVAGCNVGVTVPATGKLLKEITSKLYFDILTDANGVCVVSFDNAGGGGAYTDRLALVLPDGTVVVSDALNVANA